MSELAIKPEAAIETVELIELAYWPCGYFDYDVVTSLLIDSTGGVNGKSHTLAKVPSGLSSEDVQQFVNYLNAARENDGVALDYEQYKQLPH